MATNDTLKSLLAQCLRESETSYLLNTLIQEFPTMQELMNATEEEMRLIKGIGTVKAKQISAIVKLISYAHTYPDGSRIIVRSPQDVYQLVRPEMEYLPIENFMVLGLSTKNHVNFKQVVSAGSLNASIVHPRETFRLLIRRSCASTILVHNHPSGDPEPSKEDIELTKRLKAVGELVNIPVLDHIIVGQNAYVSLKELSII